MTAISRNVELKWEPFECPFEFCIELLTGNRNY
jgi:hypothetical protein